MRHVRFVGANKMSMSAPGQPPLYYHERVDLKHGGKKFVTTVWEPSLQERKAIAEGAVIELVFVADVPPPCFLSVATTQEMEDATATDQTEPPGGGDPGGTGTGPEGA